MIFSPADKAALLRQYQQNLSRYPKVKEEVDTFLRDKEASFVLCMAYLYGHMAAQDVLSQPVDLFAGYARATLEASAQLAYVKNIPPEIFFPYVLQHRVNSECLDDSRVYLLEQLRPYVQGKTMAEAALAVNYWCYAHATYTPADDRTLGPLAILRRTLGRCGEESVLAVAALRSVGIPARQCYCPRWSHCDDNHAWVEVWIDGSWHYMGACEPEPVLNRGWFTAAASRAMLVDTKCWAVDALYETVNCTAHYAPTCHLSVLVTEDGIPAPHARVQFQVVNYSQLTSLWEAETDEAGVARFETGVGDLFVCAQRGQKVALQKVDLRQQNTLTLALEDAFPAQLTADLVPPADTSGTVPHPRDAHHETLLRQCEQHLAARRAAAENPALQCFSSDPRFSREEKEALLDTLRPKDRSDITAEALIDALETANPVRGRYPAEIFRRYILYPRVADEMLLPERRKIRTLFPQGFESPRQILAWMEASMEILPDQGITNYYPSAYGCLRNRQVPAFAFDMVFVSLCRAFCYPARLDPHTRQAQWLDANQTWQNIMPQEEPVCLTLFADKRLNYGEHLTLGLWDGGDFVTLQYPDLSLEKAHTFRLQPGLWRVTVTTRQIDGTASVTLWHISLSRDTALRLAIPEDQTPRRLKQIPLALPAGPLQRLLAEKPHENTLLLFADPGSEPTEHLLREMLALAAPFQALPCRILLLTDAPDHPTMQLLTQALPKTQVRTLRDPEGLAALYRQMQVGDLRLPFAVCTDKHGRGVYAAANYEIRMAQRLLEIQQLIVSHN